MAREANGCRNIEFVVDKADYIGNTGAIPKCLVVDIGMVSVVSHQR